MSDEERQRQAATIVSAIQRHPRTAYQELVATDEQVARLRNSLPLLVPFGETHYAGFLPVLDWDHRLPSRSILLRIYGYYGAEALAQGTEEMAARTAEINEQNKYPEFDVPDYAGLTADEAYDAEIDINSGELARIRLVSAWRRNIDAFAANTAVRVARASAEFQQLLGESRGRPDYLGDLEAVSWTPPCESSFSIWTIDCWYLMHLDTSVGKGRSFLVDPNLRKVVGVREFVVRSG